MVRQFKSRRTASFLATLAFVCFGAGIAYAECGDPWNPPYNPPAPSVAPASVSAGGEIVISATGLTFNGLYYAYVYGTGTYWNSTQLQHTQIVPDAYGDIAPFGATIPSNIPPGSYYVYLSNGVEATNSALIDVTAAAALPFPNYQGKYATHAGQYAYAGDPVGAAAYAAMAQRIAVLPPVPPDVSCSGGGTSGTVTYFWHPELIQGQPWIEGSIVAVQDGVITTMFRPDEGYAYFVGECRGQPTF